MAFQLSPGVNVSEIDLTTVVPAVATSTGAIAGLFRWGPVGERVFVDTENQLVNRFGKPTNYNAETWFTAANFLSYTNALYVSRGANTTGSSPVISVAANVTEQNPSSNVYILQEGSTANLENGMFVIKSGNTQILDPQFNTTIKIVNSTAISLPITSNNSSQVDIYLTRPETSYSAVALDTDGVVANLVNQIVKNENDYVSKDGNFDTDVLYVAKYPGAIGNSLRVAVCDNANGYSSNVALTGTLIHFEVGSNTAHVKFVGSGNTSANAVLESISIGDQILAGNSSIGLQYLQVTDNSMSLITANNTANLVVNSANIDANGFVAVNNYNNSTKSYVLNKGDSVVYVVAAGNTAINSATGALANGTTYFVTFANSSGFKIANSVTNPSLLLTGVAANVGESGHSFTTNTTTLSIPFVDQYRLHTPYSANSFQRQWEFFNAVGAAPGQSDYVRLNGNTAANDELHIVVIDDGGQFTGTPGSVLEVYKAVSRATDAKNNDTSVNYYKDVINKNSRYIWWANDRGNAESNTAMNVASATTTAPGDYLMQFGADGYGEIGEANTNSFAAIATAYDMFASAEDIDISLVMQGKPIGGTTVVNGQTVSGFQTANYIIDNICAVRKDCVAFISPESSTVLNNYGNEATTLAHWRGAIHDSSYAVMDSGYKYQYDRYNDIYRWLPLNGDIAGLCARTDQTNDAWWSPAGFNRGQIKNLIKLAFNPRKSERDILYVNGVNPVVTFPGQGTVLYGDKTLQSKPSAFDRINVRRLFIVLEKAISTAAKYSLFEFNDAFTRSQFKNLVTPYLRGVQGRRGITDFLVVCDDTNNTPQIIDTNQFVGDIYIKPARSINFIQLNFVAVGTGVQFSEVVGKF